MAHTTIDQIAHARRRADTVPADAMRNLQKEEGRDFASDSLAGESGSQRHSLQDYFIEQHRMFEDTELAPILEPRRILAPPGYHSAKCVSAGLSALLCNGVLKSAAGLPQAPTEIAAHVIVYELVRYGVPTYFIDEDFIRAVAATDLPHDFTLEDLRWPMPAMVVGFPSRFMREYLGREFSYVYAADCDAGDYSSPALPGCPTITVPKSKIAWQYYSWHEGNLESFLSAYLRQDRLDEAIQNYAYTDYTGAKDAAAVATDKDTTDRLSALMLKLLVILSTRPQLVEAGQCVRGQKIKHGRIKHRELWSPNLIGRSYRTIREDGGSGAHASPRAHWRRGHVRSQSHGPRWSLHRTVWIEPVLVGIQGTPRHGSTTSVIQPCPSGQQPTATKP